MCAYNAIGLLRGADVAPIPMGAMASAFAALAVVPYVVSRTLASLAE